MNNDKFIKNWEKDNKKGKKKYVLFFSIFSGTGSFSGFVICKLVTGKASDIFSEYYIGLAAFVGGFIGGALVALLMWADNKAKYNQLLNSNLDK